MTGIRSMRNGFKHALASGKTQIGLWLTLTSPTSAEVAAGAGFDWLLIDMEHTTNDISQVEEHLRAISAYDAEPVVRLPWNDTVLVKRLLDAGVRTLLFPFIENAEQAKTAVAATRYPPRGVRGFSTTCRANRFGRVKNYVDEVQDEICVLVQAETIDTIAQVESICAVEGVDGVFIGPADLAASMGHAGNIQHPDVHAAIVSGGKRIVEAGKAAGFLSGRDDEIGMTLGAGFQFVAVGSDTAIIARKTEELVARYKRTTG